MRIRVDSKTGLVCVADILSIVFGKTMPLGICMKKASISKWQRIKIDGKGQKVSVLPLKKIMDMLLIFDVDHRLMNDIYNFLEKKEEKEKDKGSLDYLPQDILRNIHQSETEFFPHILEIRRKMKNEGMNIEKVDDVITNKFIEFIKSF